MHISLLIQPNLRVCNDTRKINLSAQVVTPDTCQVSKLYHREVDQMAHALQERLGGYREDCILFCIVKICNAQLAMGDSYMLAIVDFLVGCHCIPWHCTFKQFNYHKLEECLGLEGRVLITNIKVNLHVSNPPLMGDVSKKNVALLLFKHI